MVGGGLTAASGGAQEQGRRRLVGETGGHRAVQIVKHALAMLGAGGDRGPDPFQPLAAGLTAAALGHAAVDDHKPNRLFRQIVGRLHARCGDKSQVFASMLMKSLGEVRHSTKINSKTVNGYESGIRVS